MKRLTIMILVCLLVAAGVQAQATKQEITVSTTQEFIEALGSDRTVIIKDGCTLNLSDELDNEQLFHRMGYLWRNDYYPERDVAADTKVSCDRFDGRQLDLVGVNNLTIRGAGKNCHIVVNPRYANVINLYRCRNIRLERLTMGHTEEGYCEGGVIYAENSQNITVANCDLYGCGTYGLEAWTCKKIAMESTVIHDCSYGIMQLLGVEDATFTDCDFVRCREFDLVGVRSDSKNILFKRCRFAQNKGQLFSLGGPIRVESCEIHHPEAYDLGDVNSSNFGYADQNTTFYRDDNPIQERAIGPAYKVKSQQGPSLKDQIADIRAHYAKVKETQKYKREAELPLDETVVTSNYMAAGAGPVKEVTTYYYNGDFDEEVGSDVFKVYFIVRKVNFGSTDIYEEFLFDEKGDMVFFFEKSGANEIRYYWSDNALIKQDLKGDSDYLTGEMVSMRMAAALVGAFDMLMNREF